MEKQNELNSNLNSIINTENYVLLPVKWFRHYVKKTNIITLNVFDKEIKPHFDECFMGLRMMFEDYDPIPKEIQDCYLTSFMRSHAYNTIQKEIENRYKNYIQTLIPIEVNLDHSTLYNITRKDTEKLMKLIYIKDLFTKAYLHIKALKRYIMNLKDNLPVEMWRKGDMVVFHVGIKQPYAWYLPPKIKRWEVQKVCNVIVKLHKPGRPHDMISYKMKYIRDDPYYIIRADKIVKYNTELCEYYKDNKY